MHMSDALITPLVGGSMLASSFGVIRHSIKKIDTEILEKRIPYMGVVGAFVFASQMINFAIPGTGSSGHIGGGMLLAILLGPHAGFLTMGSILLIQALFFADGGLLAFGCNLMNLGFFTCYVAYPFIYKPMASFRNDGAPKSKMKIYAAAITASVIGLQLGSLGVVLETILSGRSDLPIGLFLSFMQPIHLAIGIVEGVVTAAVVGYLYERREDLHFDFFKNEGSVSKRGQSPTRRTVQVILVVALVIGGFFSQYASSSPDGLEWSIENVSAHTVTENSTIANTLGEIQDQAAILPDYGFKETVENSTLATIGTSVSGITGSLITLMVVSLIGFVFRSINRRKVRKI